MVNVGLIGTGYWGKNHARVFKELLNEKIIDSLILCDINEKLVKEIAGGGIKYTTDYHDLLDDQTIDAVSIATPSATHYHLTKEFIKKQKDVFVEKPMTTNSEETRKLIRIAEKYNRILMPGHIFRYHPAVQELKRRIDKGELGNIYYMMSNRMAFSVPRKDMGVLLALGVHEVDLFCHLLNEKYPEGINAVTGTYLQPGIEEIAIITMYFKNNIRGYAFESWLSPTSNKERNLIIVGSEKSAKIDYLKFQIQMFDTRITSNEGLFKMENKGSNIVQVEQKEPLNEELKNFIECVKSRATPLSDMYSGKRAVEMIELAMKSAKEKRTIRPKEELKM